jgi:predicted nuclease of predicted toxin-antitoxin system
MSLAIDENRTILTFDSDYGELIFKHGYKPKAGVIYFRYQPNYPTEPAEIFLNVIMESQLIFENRLTVIDKTGIRQRNY